MKPKLVNAKENKIVKEKVCSPESIKFITEDHFVKHLNITTV